MFVLLNLLDIHFASSEKPNEAGLFWISRWSLEL